MGLLPWVYIGNRQPESLADRSLAPEGPEGRLAITLQGPLMLDCSDPGWISGIAALRVFCSSDEAGYAYLTAGFHR
eukprot:1143487-Pelagomonas_calceolata.AAC.1